MSEGEDIRVALARMEGKLDLSNLKHDQATVRLDNHEQRLHRHASDISSLQAANLVREGERKGFISSGRIAWAFIGAVPSGMIVAGLMKLFGV